VQRGVNYVPVWWPLCSK